MNTVKAFGFSVLLSLSMAGTAAAADNQVAMPDLSAALQKQIETRMSHLLNAELSQAARPVAVVVVRAESAKRQLGPAS
jgi:hypothetical protein